MCLFAPYVLFLVKHLAIKVRRLHSIMIYQDYFPHTNSRELVRDMASDTAYSNNRTLSLFDFGLKFLCV
ncbi:hypothetical protein ATO9_22890 [Pseudooceanicola atlanticus]|uniref:Uncharacterized protein n=1 Tax=Pseudooceanicola atlanticus TaxID=1461694 RepID=A0A0A0E6G2_9RHOB|nr:hypothetical protein ATO9_22890 [Pseudooceanicola atlanticus]